MSKKEIENCKKIMKLYESQQERKNMISNLLEKDFLKKKTRKEKEEVFEKKAAELQKKLSKSNSNKINKNIARNKKLFMDIKNYEEQNKKVREDCSKNMDMLNKKRKKSINELDDIKKKMLKEKIKCDNKKNKLKLQFDKLIKKKYNH